MKKLFLLIVLICSVSFLGLIISSCSNDIIRNTGNPQKQILTEERKAQLEAAADSVFMQVSTPGMIALISPEGEGDYIIKRGVSNLSTGAPMDENNFFRIASNTKTFTGLALLLLVEEGKINLDSTISYYLPEYNVPNGYQIKIRMLGNMTSGLYNYSDDGELWTSFIASNFLMTYPPDSLLAIAFRHPVNFPPGTNYEYCNTNIVLLGLLMEKVTGKPASQVIEEKVIRPLNLMNTYWPNTIYLLTPYCHGYNTDLMSTLVDATNWNSSWGYTAGVMISTIPDLKIWAKAVAEGKLLSEQMKAERFNWIGNHYGFCVMKAGNWIGHPGTIFGYNSHVFYNTASKITLVILANTDTGLPVEYFSDAFRNILDR
ncbi:MAG: serine hydrolase domain-containing protein [Ignavibacteria bacterium]|jgi:D-alanyl-D-alanine carboxypeptidase